MSEFINGATPIYVIYDEISDLNDYMANYLIVEQP
jgi:hypothetical protein